MSGGLTEWIWRAGIGLLIALVLYFVKDYRKSKIENDLAEETKQPTVKKVGIEALESQILAMSKAWDEERLSKDRQIGELKQQHSECRERIEKAEGLVEEMKAKAEVMQEELNSFREQLASFTRTPKETY